ncbi:putative sterigmatocystin biosynthesis P450 monooxygenase stcS [Paramyrothecium foliicola]|nr:putative sterigmatocystin biosynthesis P450 monooxygenase stcS [Paramyrothecium foliicola]
MLSLRAVIIATLCILVPYIYRRLRYLRFEQYAHIPQLPSNLLWGHIVTFGKFTKQGIADRHPDRIFEEMWIALERPPVMLVDLRPITLPMVLIPSHDIAEQISKPTKLYPLRNTSILGKEDVEWKGLRKKYNPGFTTQHLWTLLPLILEKMQPFVNHLDHFAASNTEFPLETLISNLTFDIIGAAVMEIDLNAQHMDRSQQGDIIRLFHELLCTYSDDKNNFPWWLVPRTTLKRHRLGRRVDVLVREVIQQKYAESREMGAQNQSRSILALTFRDTECLTPQLLSETSDQVRSFLFAGHDSNSSALQWALYELSRTPRALEAVRKELDEVLGPNTDPGVICARLAEDGEKLLPRLRYVNAVMKETLRLHPPAATVRMTPPGAGFTVHASSGMDYCLDGTVMYACHSIIHRDPEVFGDTADEWVPERWLGDESNTVAPSAWRPFERGPRNCIGLELANLEARVILATVARKYDFVKVGLGASLLDDSQRPVLNTKGQHRTVSELYNVILLLLTDSENDGEACRRNTNGGAVDVVGGWKRIVGFVSLSLPVPELEHGPQFAGAGLEVNDMRPPNAKHPPLAAIATGDMSTTTKRPAPGPVSRVSTSESTGPTSNGTPTRTPSSRSSTPPAAGHARSRSVRTGTPVSARAAAARRDTGLSSSESDARAEAASAVEDLQSRLENEEKMSEQHKKQAEVLQSKLDDAVKESAKLEEKVHEYEEQIETLKNEKREATRQIREMESIYEAERSSILKEKEELANREEEMQAVIQRLKDNIAQRNNEDENRPSRQANASPSLDGSSFAPPSSLQRSDSRSSSKLILQKDKLIESLRLELAEAQIKLVESENQGGGRLQEVERALMEARMANARLMEDNESYQLLLQEKTLKGDFGQNDFSYMSSNSNQDALNALEGNAGGSSLADELSEADSPDGDGDRRLEAELKNMKEQNKALTLYINKIIERLLQHQDFESILDQSGELKGLPDTNKDLPPPPDKQANGTSMFQRAKSMATGPAKPRQRPMSVMPMSGMLPTGNTDPDKAPSIPIGLSRTTSTRRSRPQSEQFTGAASLVSQMYRGPDGGPVSPTLTNPRHSQTYFSPVSFGGNPNAAARVPSGSHQAPASSGNFPGMRSETSSMSGDSAELSTPPSQSPPRSEKEKQTTSFAGGKPRPLRLVQENPDAVKDNKRASWYSGWSWGKKEEGQPAGQPIPE